MFNLFFLHITLQHHISSSVALLDPLDAHVDIYDVPFFVCKTLWYKGYNQHHGGLLSFFRRTLKPSPSEDESVLSRDLPTSPPVNALHFGLADWVSTPAPHQLTTNSVDYFVYSRSYAFHGRNHTLRRKNPMHRDSNRRFLP